MKKEPLVSVIIPTYNREKILPLAINSVIDQIYKNWELIIVDDRSTDKTKELVQNYMKKDKRIKYFINTHKKGPAGARNQGMEIARGKYIAFLDSDDEWFKHHLKESIKVLESKPVKVCSSLWYERKNGRIFSCYDDVKFFNKITGKLHEDNRGTRFKKAIKDLNMSIKKKILVFDSKFCEYCLLRGILWCNTDTLVFKRSILDKIGLFNEKLFSFEDTEFEFRLALNSNICMINDHHAIYNEGGDNLCAINLSNKNKIISHKKYSIKGSRMLKKIIKHSSKFKKPKECMKIIDKHLLSEYSLELACINIKINKLKALYYYLLSIYYYYDTIKLKAIKELFIGRE